MDDWYTEYDMEASASQAREAVAQIVELWAAIAPVVEALAVPFFEHAGKMLAEALEYHAESFARDVKEALGMWNAINSP